MIRLSVEPGAWRIRRRRRLTLFRYSLEKVSVTLSDNLSMSTDLTFVTNEPGNNLRDRFNTLLTDDTRHFDCLVGYFYISGFHKIYLALENVDKVRILVGLQTDRTAYELWQRAQRDGELVLQSQASTKQRISQDVLSELEKAPDTEAIETGVHKFVEAQLLSNSVFLIIIIEARTKEPRLRRQRRLAQSMLTVSIDASFGCRRPSG